MWEITLYENGETYEYYTDASRNAITLFLKSQEQLEMMITIATQSGHSIEIKELKEDEN